MLRKLLYRLFFFVLLLLVINIATLLTLSQHEFLIASTENYSADGRLNSGTELIIRDVVAGLAETGTMETFSNTAIANLMESLNGSRRVRKVMYRPEPVSVNSIENEPFELNMAISSQSRLYFLIDAKVYVFRDDFLSIHEGTWLWFFGWRKL